MADERERVGVHLDDAEFGARGEIAGPSLERSGGKQVISFAYAPEWVAESSAFPIDPSLPLHEEEQYPPGLPGIFADAPPDRWGRNCSNGGRPTLLGARSVSRVCSTIGTSSSASTIGRGWAPCGLPSTVTGSRRSSPTGNWRFRPKGTTWTRAFSGLPSSPLARIGTTSGGGSTSSHAWPPVGNQRAQDELALAWRPLSDLLRGALRSPRHPAPSLRLGDDPDRPPRQRGGELSRHRAGGDRPNRRPVVQHGLNDCEVLSRSASRSARPRRACRAGLRACRPRG
jgi:HipA N-terminal domain